jgi:hypothetical protein
MYKEKMIYKQSRMPSSLEREEVLSLVTMNISGKDIILNEII